MDDSWFVVHGGGAAAGGGETRRALGEALRRSLSHRREASGKKSMKDSSKQVYSKMICHIGRLLEDFR
jgi:hypothetical protein